MTTTAATILLCDCTGTMAPDAAAIERGCGARCSRVHTCLCRDQAADAANALRNGGEVIIACGQEAPAFRDLAEELAAADRLTCVDIRDRAGWSDDHAAGPKMAALIADARLPAPPVPAMDVTSEGICLVYGAGDTAMAAAARLAPILSVTVMLTEPDDVLVPGGADMEVVSGRIAHAGGALGRFEIEVDRFAELLPPGRGPRRFGSPRDGAQSGCDVIVDLSGGAPLFPAHHKRDGYVRADPRDSVAVERAVFDAAQLVGTFEKPLHIRFEAAICAHSRAGQVGCTRCLDVCPTSAIRPAGDSVEIDPHVCAGCGSCAAVCPTGAATADDPPVQHIFARMRAMAEAYRRAGGAAPRLLVHDDHGAEMIRLAARFGRGLPADVVPMEVRALAAFGHAEQLAALAVGFAAVDILPAPRTEREVIGREMALANAVAGGAAAAPADTGAAGIPVPDPDDTSRINIVEADDPDALSELLYAARLMANVVEPILPIGGRRDVTRLAATALAGGAPPETPIALPHGAPYGTVDVDTQACTLCLACVGLCPTGALGDNPDRPEVNFRETACVQCGICATACPEAAIRLEPRLDLTPAALAPRELNAEEPFCCVECGKPFGTKSTIERITAKLSGVHSMFTNSDNVRLIQMCDDCRIRTQFNTEAAPFRMGERPRVRTTDDYTGGRNDG